MDLTIRDWMVIVGVLLILAVLLDAWRRVRNERRAPVRVKLARGDAAAEEPADDIGMLRELPNGGARVVERSDLLDAAAQHKAEKADRAAVQRAGAQTAASTPQEAPPPSPPAQEPAPRPGRGPESRPTPEPRVAAGSEPAPRPAPEPQSRPPKPERASTAAQASSAPPEEEFDLLAGFNSTDEPANLDWLDALAAQEPEPEDEAPGRLPRDVEPEVFMLNVVARNPEGFAGEDILHILLACDLRFGDMNFFHRHEFEAGRGAIQFSVANMMQPGVFDIDNMADFRTPGLVFFVTLPGPQDMMQAFDYMLETAQTVARNLAGDVLDESRSALTRQTLEHNRQQIRDLERRMLARSR
ncbi:cell division protein ZipA [Kineobactrum salinum]|uniref:Cell division protein ZipA n=1 Tax=Kineobactrum salinum TaxID=2708301 RepID=A0A6C0U5Q9_9GAMM|nr:cell division protein ZipA [Kineobactrum salinum]QIB67500.1 cell division protein ZipA [Kineobactrum salinum]